MTPSARTRRTAQTTTPAAFEPMEARTLYSASPAAPRVVGYMQDWQMPCLVVQSDAGTVTSDEIDWAALTQVNYFAVLPNATGNLPTTPRVFADGKAISGTTA